MSSMGLATEAISTVQKSVKKQSSHESPFGNCTKLHTPGREHYSVQLRKHGQPIKKRENVKQDLKYLKAIKSKDDLIKAYPDQLEGIGKFLGTYHISLRKDGKPVVHTNGKCSIAIQPLVDKKLDKLLELYRTGQCLFLLKIS